MDIKINIRGGTSPKTLRHLVSLALLSAALGARAASVTPGGYTNDFSSPPAAADFATATISGGSGDVVDAAGLDAAAAQLTAASIITPITSAAGAPPNGAGTAIFNSAGNNLQTRPSGVKMCVLMATFTNNSGANATSVRLIYSLIQSTIVAEQVEGVRVYYSLTGAASSWTFVPAWSATAAGLVNASVTLAAPWNVGSPLYLLFADDNGSPSPDTANQIDNFSFAVSGPAPELPVAIASQPQDRTVYESQPATFTVGVNGNAPYTFHWYRGTDPIANATNASYTLVNAQLADSGALFSVVAANVASNISYTATSGVATLTVNALPTNCVVAPAGIVGWWPLDGNVSDLANNNPTILTGIPVYVSGKVGTGLSFDGVSKYVRAPASAALDVGNGNGFTVELWINPAQVTTPMPLIEWFNADQSSLYLWTSVSTSGTSPGALFANINDTARGPHYLPAPAGILQAGIFQHVALTYDKATGIGRLYLNGAKVAEQNLGSFAPKTDWDVCFGARPSPVDFQLYQGLMDEISIYSRALSGAEIQAIAVAGALGKCQPQAPPSIVSQPHGLTVPVGTSATFIVSAVGSSPLAYQWRFNGAPLSGATNSTLALSGVQTNQAGGYSVVISNPYGSVTSSAAVFTVYQILPGTVVAWGNNSSGQTNVPVGLSGVTAIAAGFYHTVALKNNGTVVAWGGNGNGQATIPAGLSGVIAIAAGDVYTVAVKGDGTVTGWGDNGFGQLTIPAGLSGVMAVTAGRGHTVALKNNGTVVAWGRNEWGQASVPAGLSGVIAIAAGDVHTIALKGDGTVVAWGYNGFGEAVVPAGLSGVTAIAAGGYHNVVLKNNGALVSWGLSSAGQTTIPAGLSGVTALAGGSEHSVALKNDGTVVAWGRNTDGQTTIPAGLSGVTAIASGTLSTVALVVVTPTPPGIIIQPQTANMPVGTNVTFYVTLTGSAPFSFQWNKDGSPIPDATNSTLALNKLQLAQSGDYTVNVANQIGSVTSQVATLTVTVPSTNCVPVPAGLVGWWPLDGSVSEVVNTNSTTLAGVPSYVFGKVGTGLSFDGVSNYVRAPASVALDVGTGNGFTVELWINPAQVNTQMPLLEWFNAGQSSLYLWTSVQHPGTGPGGLFANINDTGGGPHYLPAPAGILQAGIFQHVALTYDKITGIGRIFLNGANVAEQNLGSFTPRSSWDVYFGARPVAPNFFLYQGLMDEIGIYNRALSGAEIQAIAVAGALGKCQPQVPPSIISQPQGLTVSAGTNVVFTVAVAGSSPLIYQWNLSGSPLLDATNATLPFVNVQPAQSGDYTVVVSNQFGSVTSQVATLTVFIPRILALQAQPQSQEGTRVQIPLTLISTGDVAGMTFTINYDTNYLRDLQFSWDPLIQGGFNQENQATPGVVSASFVLSENIPGGTQHLATLDFLLRSVPATLDTALTVTLQDASDAQGNTVPVNTTVAQGCSQRILVRRIIGDNNANDRLDVGDATVILRFLALLDPVRAWDATGNDVNQNTSLDSGDVTKVLRAAAGIDPQPPVPPGVGKNRASQAAPPAQLLMPAGQFILTPDWTNGTPGQQVTVQVRLQNNASPLSGASFTLNYSTNALRLANSSAYRLGPIVPGGTLAQWNVAPSQNNFATQNGRLTLAASSANAWPSSNGVLAEVTFTIQPGATGQYLWPLTLTGGETTASGFDNHLFPTANASFIGRVPVAGQLASLVRLAGGQFQFSLAGDTGGTYAVDASTDLIGWTPIQTNALPAGGSLLVQDPAATGQPHRFYRVRSLY